MDIKRKLFLLYIIFSVVFTSIGIFFYLRSETTAKPVSIVTEPTPKENKITTGVEGSVLQDVICVKAPCLPVPVSNAYIFIYDQSKQLLKQKIKTDDNGHYKVTIAKGSYFIGAVLNSCKENENCRSSARLSPTIETLTQIEITDNFLSHDITIKNPVEAK